MATTPPTLTDTTSQAHRPLAAYAAAESRLWEHYGATPRERMLHLESLGVRVRVQEIGEGQPVLFVHGGPNAGSTFAPLVPGMAGRRCLLLDRPGCGLSGPVDYRRMPMPRLAAEVLARALDELGLGQVDLVASSFGGAWALWLALAYPGRVRRLALLGAPALVPGMLLPGFMKLLVTPLVGSGLAALLRHLPPSVDGPKPFHRQMGHADTVLSSVIPPVYWLWASHLFADTPTMSSDLGAIRRVVTRRGARPEIAFSPEQLRSVSAPTLLYWGDADTFGGADLARATADLLPDSRLEIVPSGGHLPWLDDPGRAAASITRFLDHA